MNCLSEARKESPMKLKTQISRDRLQERFQSRLDSFSSTRNPKWSWIHIYSLIKFKSSLYSFSLSVILVLILYLIVHRPLTMPGVIVSPFLRFIRRRVADHITASKYHELDEIAAYLKDIEGAVHKAELERGDDIRVSEWLRSLQEVLEEVDNLVDEVQMNEMMMSSNNQKSQLMPAQVSFSLSRFNPFSESKSLAQSFQAITLLLIGLLDNGIFLRDYIIEKLPVRQEDFNMPFLLGISSGIFGRERDEAAVIDLILKSVDSSSVVRVSVVPIVGFIGVGKTALAQLIYDDPRIQHISDLKLWIYLPQGSDAVLYIIKQALTQLGGAIQDDRDAEQMKTELHKLIAKKRIFIVLDHFEDSNVHKRVLTLVQDMASEGSAIIVTTRSRRAASLIGTTPPYQLDALSEDASRQLLTECSGLDLQSYPRVVPAVRDMVKWCNGVPLFMKAVALRLKYVTPEMHQRYKQLYQDRGFGYLIASKFSSEYTPYLDDCIRVCEKYLRMPLESFRLQKACGLSVEALSCVWMALGFLYSDDPTLQQPEHIASKYLGDILECSLCPDGEYAPGGVVSRIKFNDALLDIATFCADVRWEIMPRHSSFQKDEHIPRYVVWDKDDLSAASISSPLNKVRLFILCSRRQASARLVNDIISGFKCLRVLGFGGCNIEMLPDSIGELKHLRYLDVGRNARMTRLPDSICDLWHLQTLFLHGCSQLEELPANLGRLQNLRYLTLTILKESLPKEMGQLVSLRKLGLSRCPRLASLPSSIKKLKNLQTLGIVDCPVLDLTAPSSVEGLKGLDAINTLLLSHLPKFAGLPADLGSPSVAMKHLMIQSCPSVTETRWIAQFRILRSLTVEDCPKLQDLALTDATSQLDHLWELVIRRCPSLGSTAWIRQFISLRSLIVDGCPKLVELDTGFSELKNLERVEIRRCPGLSKWFASPAGKAWLRIVHVRAVELDGVHLKYSYLTLM